MSPQYGPCVALKTAVFLFEGGCFFAAISGAVLGIIALG
jgi:hypothetical protein